MSKPNVLVLISHDTGKHVSPYGVETVDTPNFERLAGMSVTFDNAFCCSPQCSPARAALFSGTSPHSAGV
ncbi:MAG: sulfatase-like hydrolase/transferase, partial [Planctomycetota bacterium]